MGKIIEVKGNLLEMDNIDVICNENNTLGIMGGGIALQIANKWNKVKKDDIRMCHMYGNDLLGTSIFYKIDKNRAVVNMYAQSEVGTEKRQLDYTAFGGALNQLAFKLNKEPYYFGDFKTVGFPKFIGCGLAGGDWDIVYTMIKDFAERVPQDIYIVEFQK